MTASDDAAHVLETAEVRSSSAAVRLAGAFDRYGVLLLVLVMAIVSFLAQPDIFLSERNILNIFRQNSF